MQQGERRRARLALVGQASGPSAAAVSTRFPTVRWSARKRPIRRPIVRGSPRKLHEIPEVGSGGQGQTNSPGANLDMRSMPKERGPGKARVHQPSTRGFSITRRARLGARKAKKRNVFPRGRPNRPARPSLFRAPGAGTDRLAQQVQQAQRRRRIAIELGPNRIPGCKVSLVGLR